MIIIEGPDGSGKTTLMNSLINDLELEMAPRASHSIDGPNVNIGDYVRATALSGQERLIFDRHPMISELVYGPLLRGGVNPSLLDCDYAHKEWLESQLVIFCLPPLEAVKANVIASGQMKGVASNITAIYHSYQALANLIPNSYVYDYEDFGSRMVLGLVMTLEFEKLS